MTFTYTQVLHKALTLLPKILKSKQATFQTARRKHKPQKQTGHLLREEDHSRKKP